ncbi:hypothetical protein [Actinoplanes sp. NPDC051859]|uniref:hypothetical protein n=1 Tax=Actinoplanes sp. NPDC051859 TaxID=3363909 RepID=UPI0037B8DC5B
MTHLDDLKDAMHSPPDFEPRPLDLGTVLAEGGRLRRRRRIAMGATSVATAAVLLAGGGALAHFGAANQSGPSTAAAGPGTTSSSALPTVSAAPGAPDPTPGDSEPERAAEGDVIDTGLRTKSGEPILLWFVAIKDAALPNTSFGVIAGQRTSAGRLESKVATNEFEGSDRAPGFHAGQAATETGNFAAPAFGYFAGNDLARITALADGKTTVEAKIAPWSKDPSIRVFWFDPAKVKADTELSKVVAYDSAGTVLKGKDATFGVG